MIPSVGLNGVQARGDYAHHLMVAEANQVRQRPSHVFLVIGDQDAHVSKMEKLPCQVEDRRLSFGGLNFVGAGRTEKDHASWPIRPRADRRRVRYDT